MCEICIFWKAFFVFAILQSVDALDQKNVYYELKQRDRYASTTGWTKKNVSLLQTKTLSTSYSKTTILLGVEI